METLQKKRSNKEIWLELVQKHEGMFVSCTHAGFLEKSTAKRLKNLLQKARALADQDETNLNRVLGFAIEHGCSFLERPTIQHSSRIERCIIDRRSFGNVLKVTDPELHEFYTSNRLRRTHVWNAINSVNLLLSENSISSESLIMRSNSLSLINTKEQKSMEYFEQLNYGEKLIIASRVKDFVIAGVKLYLKNSNLVSPAQSLSFAN